MKKLQQVFCYIIIISLCFAFQPNGYAAENDLGEEIPLQIRYNGEIILDNYIPPLTKDGYAYLPVELIVEAHGGICQYNEQFQSAIILSGDGKTKIELYANQSKQKKNGELVAPATIYSYGQFIDLDDHTPIVHNGELYASSASFGMYSLFEYGYTGHLSEDFTRDIRYFGEVIVDREFPNDPYSYPKGWVPPTIQSKATYDKMRNLELLKDQLHLYSIYENAIGLNGWFPNIASTMLELNQIMIGTNESYPYEADLVVKGWKMSGDEYPTMISINKNPYLVKGFLEFYFDEQNANALYKAIEGIYEDENIMNKYLKRTGSRFNYFTFGNRQVHFSVMTGGALGVAIGKKGYIYDGNAEQIWAVKSKLPSADQPDETRPIYEFINLINLEEIEVDGNVTFTDMSKHWAKEEVMKVAERGIIKGIGNNRFNPNAHITRAEVMTILSRIIATTPEKLESVDYSDVHAIPNYAKEAFRLGKTFDILNGYNDHTVRPNNKIKRAEIAALLNRILEKVEDEKEPVSTVLFKDPLPNWAKEDINTVAQYGIIMGNEKGEFLPNKYATRAEFTAMVNRLLEK